MTSFRTIQSITKPPPQGMADSFHLSALTFVAIKHKKPKDLIIKEPFHLIWPEIGLYTSNLELYGRPLDQFGLNLIGHMGSSRC